MSRQYINNTNQTTQHYDSSFITLYCDFSYGGAAVDVINPVATITDSLGVLVSVNVVQPLSKLNEDVTGRYIFSFLSEGLAAGSYTVRFSGVYPANSPSPDTISITGKFDIAQISIELYYIQWLRQLLFDAYTDFYRISNPNEYTWNTESLYTCLKTSLSRIGGVPPAEILTFSSARALGYEALLLDGARYDALLSRSIGEIINDFSYSDGLSLTYNRHEKYRSMAQDLWGNWLNQVSLKKNQINRSGAWRGVRGWPMPPITAMVLALLPNWQNTMGMYS